MQRAEIDGLAIDGHNLIAFLKADGVGIFAIGEAEWEVLELDDVLAPVPAHADVDEDGGDEVIDYATYHDHELCELAFLDEEVVALHVLDIFGRMGLIDHTRDGAIATQRDPTDTILRLARIGLRRDLEVAEEETFLVPTEECELWGIEEHIELLDTDLKYTCPHEVTELMNKHEDAQSEDQLEGLKQKYFHYF